jgi:hypothetical protein
LITIEFNEPLSTTADGEKFLINGLDSKIATDIDNRKLLYLSLHQGLPENETVEITVLAGAIKDELGNLSAENKVSVTNQSASTNALLGGLAVDSAVLTTGFNLRKSPKGVASLGDFFYSATKMWITHACEVGKLKRIVDKYV